MSIGVVPALAVQKLAAPGMTRGPLELADDGSEASGKGIVPAGSVDLRRGNVATDGRRRSKIPDPVGESFTVADADLVPACVRRSEDVAS